MITLIERKEKASPILDKPRHVETLELGKKDRGQRAYGDRLNTPCSTLQRCGKLVNKDPDVPHKPSLMLAKQCVDLRGCNGRLRGWLDNYYKENPLESFEDAVGALISELHPKRLKEKAQ